MAERLIVQPWLWILAVQEAGEEGTAYKFLEYFRSGATARPDRLCRSFTPWWPPREGFGLFYSVGLIFPTGQRVFPMVLYRGVEPGFPRMKHCIVLRNGAQQSRQFPEQLQCSPDGVYSLTVGGGMAEFSFDAAANELAEHLVRGTFALPKSIGYRPISA